MVVVPSLNVIVPVGVAPPDTGATAAVNVTGVPTANDGFGELKSDVVVAPWPSRKNKSESDRSSPAMIAWPPEYVSPCVKPKEKKTSDKRLTSIT